MNDLAFGLLRRRLSSCISSSQQSLWVVDENIDVADIASVSPANNLQVMTNRYDIYTIFQKAGFNVQISDFDFSQYSMHYFSNIYYRISKEKAIVHYIINNAQQYLKENGALFLCGYKNEGIKTYINKAEECLGERIERERGGKTSVLAAIAYRPEIPLGERKVLDDNAYSTLRVISGEESLPIVSKPGQFGWSKVDQGSAFLIGNLPQLLQKKVHLPKCIIDLGCGYGYLSIMASQLCDAEFIATDNNCAAVTACEKNFKQYAINGNVILDDCAADVKQSVDTVICNPPFHQGFSVDSNLSVKFLLACRRLLLPGGQALFVVNSFIALEKKAINMFTKVSVIANNNRFKLVLLIK